MNENFDKTKEALQKEILNNLERIDINDKKQRVSNFNQFEFKVKLALVFSMLSYLGLTILSGILAKNGIVTSIPIESVSLAIAGSSLCVGFIGVKIVNWKTRIKEKLRSFTNANTESEKIEEEVKYTIELEKARNRNRAIYQTMNSLSSKQAVLNDLSGRYDINDRTMPQTEDVSEKRVENLSILLKDKYTELDVLTTQKILHGKFLSVRTKFQRLMEIIECGMMGAFLSMLYGCLPLLVLKDYLASSGLVSVLTPLIVGAFGASGYMIKKNKDYMKAFNNLNSKLGENSLPDKLKEAYKEQQDIDTKMENIIGEISIVEMQLQEQKRIMESFLENGETEQTIESKEHSVEIQNQNLVTVTSEDIFVGEEKESQEQEKGPKLVLRKSDNS